MGTLEWKNKEFNNLCEISKNGHAFAEMKYDIWYSKATYKSHQSQFILRSNGFFSNTLNIFESSGTHIIGKLQYNGWGSKAKIIVGKREYQLKYNNGWQTNWTIGNGIESLTFQSRLNKGELYGNTDNEILIACGLYNNNRNSFFTIIIALFVVFFVIL